MKRPVLTAEPAGISSGMALSAGRVSAHASPQSHYKLPPVTRVDVRTGSSHMQAVGTWTWASSQLSFPRKNCGFLMGGSKPRQKFGTPPANAVLSYFIKLKNTCKHLCAGISQNGSYSGN